MGILWSSNTAAAVNAVNRFLCCLQWAFIDAQLSAALPIEFYFPYFLISTPILSYCIFYWGGLSVVC